MGDPTNSTASGRPRADAPNVGVATTFHPPSTMDDEDLDHPAPPSSGGYDTNLDMQTVDPATDLPLGVTIGQIHGGTPGYAPVNYPGIGAPDMAINWQIPLPDWQDYVPPRGTYRKKKEKIIMQGEGMWGGGTTWANVLGNITEDAWLLHQALDPLKELL